MRYLLQLCGRLLRFVGWAAAAGAACAFLLAVAIAFFWLSPMGDLAAERNKYVRNEIAKLDKTIDEIKVIRDQISAMEALRQVFARIQADRAWPVAMFGQLARVRTDGTYFTAVADEGAQVVLAGRASTYGDVAALVKRLAESPVFRAPRITHIATDAARGAAEFPVAFKVAVTVAGRPASAGGPQAKSSVAPQTRAGDPK